MTRNPDDISGLAAGIMAVASAPVALAVFVKLSRDGGQIPIGPIPAGSHEASAFALCTLMWPILAYVALKNPGGLMKRIERWSMYVGTAFFFMTYLFGLYALAQ